MLLLATHLRRQLEKGKQGVLALFSLFYLSLRIAVGAVRQAVLRGVAKAVQLLPHAAENWVGGRDEHGVTLVHMSHLGDMHDPVDRVDHVVKILRQRSDDLPGPEK